VPITVKMMILEELGLDSSDGGAAERVKLDTLGLNHLSWHRGFTLDGEDLWPQIMAHFNAGGEKYGDVWDMETIRTLNMIPNYYLQYYYYTDHKLAEQEAWPPSRAEEVMVIEKELLAQYAEPDRSEPPEGLIKRGGAYYSTVATQLLTAHYNDLGETHVINVPHRGAVTGWPEDWVLELPCRVGRDGFTALPTGPLPPVASGLLAQVKSYELLTVKAAVTGDRDLAYQAILANPLGPSADKVSAVLEDMLQTHKAYLPQFWP
jgi:6-phospho-beta-glucosidase